MSPDRIEGTDNLRKVAARSEHERAGEEIMFRIRVHRGEGIGGAWPPPGVGVVGAD